MDGVAASLAFEKQLKAMGFDMSSVTQIINAANNDASCGPECKRQRKLAELRDAMIAAKKASDDAPQNLADARKNYYLYRDGQKGYMDAQLLASRKVAQGKTAKLDNEFQARAERVQTLVDELEAMRVYNANTDDLLNKYSSENHGLVKDIDDTKTRAFTNDRRFHYYEQTIGWQWYINKFVTLSYWLLVAVYIGYYILYKGHYTDKRKWVYGAGLVALPYVITFLLTFSLYGYSIQGFADRMINAIVGYV